MSNKIENDKREKTSKVIETNKDKYDIVKDLKMIIKFCGIALLYTFLVFFTKLVYTPMNERKCIHCKYYLDYNTRTLGIYLIIGFTLFFLLKKIIKKCKWLYYLIIAILTILTAFFAYKVYDIIKFDI